MRRDRLTFAMIVGIPIVQVLLFGFVINTDPKALPTAIVDYDRSDFSRSISASLVNTRYFAIVPSPPSMEVADAMLARGDIQFAVVFPAGFSRQLMRGDRPSVLVAADATDPSATGNAIAALTRLETTALMHDLHGSLAAHVADQAGTAPRSVSFAPDVAAALSDAAMEAVKDTYGLIIDLRDASGGNISCIRLASYFSQGPEMAVTLASRAFLEKVGSAPDQLDLKKVPSAFLQTRRHLAWR